MIKYKDLRVIKTCKCGKKMRTFDVSAFSDRTHQDCSCGRHWYGLKGSARFYTALQWFNWINDTNYKKLRDVPDNHIQYLLMRVDQKKARRLLDKNSTIEPETINTPILFINYPI